MILQVTDFDSGQFHISTDINTINDLTLLLTDNNEKSLIYELMGKSLGDLFIADLAGTPSTPQSAIWQTIFNYFTFEDDRGVINTCQGLKEYLIARVYDQYISGQSIVNQASGNGRIQSDATSVEALLTKQVVLYNRTQNEGKMIQEYLWTNPTDYPNFKGLELFYRSPL